MKRPRSRGTASIVYRLLFAVTVAVIAFVILVQLMKINQGALVQTTDVVKNGTMDALQESMKYLSD